MGLYTTQAKYLHNKLRINFPYPLPLINAKNLIYFMDKLLY